MPIFVNMQDKALSGWGMARRGRSIHCVECDTWAQAAAIEKAANARPEMIRVAVSENPRRGRRGDHVSIRHVRTLGGPWLQYMAPGDMPADQEA